MGGGSIMIKRVPNTTVGQLTYHERDLEIFRKAEELSILCDANVSLIMFSSTGRLSEFTSPCTTMKKVYDQYQLLTGEDMWNSHYERMQVSLKHQTEVNIKLRKEIRQRMGEDLDDMTFEELRSLEQDLDASAKVVRDRKFHVINIQIETYKKKVRNQEHTQDHMMREFEARLFTNGSAAADLHEGEGTFDFENLRLQ